MRGIAPVVVLALLAMFCSVGCKASPASVPSASSVFQLLEQAPAQGSVRAVDLYPSLDAERHYAVLNEEGAIAGEFMRRRIATTQFNATQAETELDREIEYRIADDQGNIVMPAHIDMRERVITHFSPPIVIAFRELHAGQTLTSESAMRIVERANPSKVKETGKAVRTMQYIGDQRIRTPLGEFLAKRIEVQFIADLRLADAEDNITLFLVPGLGIVAEQSHTKIKILGAFSKTEHRTAVLISEPQR